MRFKFILLDNDGVLTPETSQFHLKKINEFGCLISKKEYQELAMGNWYKKIEKTPFSNVDWRGYLDFIFSDYEKIKIPKKSLECLNNLYYTRYLAMISSGSERIIRAYLKQNNIEHYFLEILGKETSESKVQKFRFILNNYDILPSEVLFVTDSLGDIFEANEVGIKTVGISWGIHNRKTLEKGNPFKIIDTFSEIENIVYC